MVIPNRFNADDRDMGPFDAAVRSGGARVVSRGKDQSPASGKIKGKLPEAIPFERMGIARNQIGDTRSRLQCKQAQPQLTRRGRPEPFLGDGLLLTQIADFLVLVLNVQGTSILSIFTYKVN
ncbi:hypothetical protein [Zoogloea sp.]|uniref:hypothetical protein n=1 Tax=Zoogloea sp. TaxID=49181 RepID=UPI001B69700B|nr:hypothetical protein [Zoogloea sp.]MBK6656524.1 hypothetical protein [Zoogloea sp.]MBP7445543.1 hypothetical protein [Zoogloea sp.]HOY03569.1 hypothetical protein [Zoogloea sp.]